MTKYLFGAFALMAAACGGGSKSTVDATASIDAPLAGPDAGTPDADVVLACNPLAAAGQQGCATGQKCTWIDIQDTPDTIGKLGCVPDGTVALGGTCARGAAGEATGYDNCAAGGICIGSSTAGVCKDLCGFDGSVSAACDPGGACTRYSGLGANGADAPVIGACNPTCDPLHQTRIVNGVTQSCGTNQGCYLLASTVDTIAVCAGAGTGNDNDPINGTTYANSCAPGHVPRVAVQGATGNECAALCKPADVYMGNQEAYEGGDTRETNWMTPPKPATCESDGGPSVAPGTPGTGETCEYYWTRESATVVTNFSNTLGWCFNYASWKYDPDGMDPVTNTDPYPRCPSLTTGDVLPPHSTDPTMPKNDALYFGCIAEPATMLVSPARQYLHLHQSRARKQPVLDRLGPYNR
jgi:hypothetical protein